MSVRLLRHPTRRLVPKYADALESFWHTLLYITLRHCDHNYSSREIVSVLEVMSDYTFENGRMVGGVQKRDELKTRRDIMKMGIAPLSDISCKHQRFFSRSNITIPMPVEMQGNGWKVHSMTFSRIPHRLGTEA